VGAHCTGYNKDSIGICYIGGLDKNGKSKDTRTEAQKKTIITLIRILKARYPSIKEVIGHRDTSPDLNKNGVIEPKEYLKDCPCFNAKEEYKNI
jgi:N-acetyl-anhydromuramyl-L-alanine amidase AmpD